MRLTPIVLSLAIAGATMASAGYGQRADNQVDPRSAALVERLQRVEQMQDGAVVHGQRIRSHRLPVAAGGSALQERVAIGIKQAAAVGRKAQVVVRYAAVDGAPSAWVVRDDIAAAAAGLLATGGYEGATLHATGPASVTHAQIADMLSRVAGRPIRYSPLTIEQFEAGLRNAGLPPPVIDVLSRFQAAARDGFFDLVTHDVERLSGSPAEPVEAFIARHLKSASAPSRSARASSTPPSASSISTLAR